MDVLRRELLLSSTGLPLGMLTAKTQFVNPTFLASPDFRSGIGGLPKRKAIFLGLLIAVCSVLTLLVGPSSALLLLPGKFDDWPGGGAKFFLVGANESNWPSALNSESIGGTHCQSPSAKDLDLQLLNMSSRVWSGYSSILHLIQSSHYLDTAQTFTIQDGLVLRQMILRGVGGWAYAVHVATCLYSEVLTSIWYDAIFEASTAQGLHKFSTLSARERNGNTMTIKSQIPAVRTNCFINSSTIFDAVTNKVRQSCPLGNKYQ